MRILSIPVRLAAVVLLVGVVLGYGGPLYFDLDLLGNFRLHALGLSFATAIAALVLRARAAMWRALAAAVLAAAGLGPLWAGPGPAGEGVAVTVMTANIYGGNPVPEAMRRALLAADADILLTIETPRDAVGGIPGAGGVGGVVGVSEDAALADVYPYHFIFYTGATIWRTVLWSKAPIIHKEWVLQDEHSVPAGVRAVVRLAPGRELSVLGVHLSHVWMGRQAEQIAAMDTMVAGLPQPLVVMGDFNATAWSWAVRRAQTLTGTRRVGGVTRTWSGRYPTPLGPFPEPFGLPIDHIMVSAGIGVETIGTVKIPGSDHDAVRAVLRIP